jgi:polysaccharide chain length determinant protein (PEP-CTERM system associated)
MEEFEKIKELILLVIRGIWKNRWIAIGVAWPLLIAGVLFVDSLNNKYTAQTKVHVDTTSVLKPLLKGLAIQTDFESNVRLMIRQLLSRPNLERAARLMDMDINVQTEAEMERLIQNIRKRVDVEAITRSGNFSIEFTDENRDVAKAMVQTLLDIFIEDTLGKTVTDSDSAISFIDGQIEKYELLLQQAEQRLEEFKRENMGLMPGEGGNYYKQLQKLDSELESTELQLLEETNRRNKLRSELDELVMPSPTSNKTVSSFDDRILEQEAQLDELLLLYTDEHPDVINARFILDMLKKKREQELQQGGNTVKSQLTENKIYQELQILLSQAEASISTLSTRVRSFKAKQQQLRERVDIVPKIEAELQRLNRDYNVHKQNYTALVKRREQAKISEEVETGTEQVKFRIIEPPYVPSKPSFPNRPLFDVAILILALAGGYGVGLLVSFFQPVFFNPNDLKNYFDLPVLGAVRKFDTEEVIAKRRRNLLLFSVANTLLLGVGLMFAIIHSQGILILEQLVGKGAGL